MSNDRRDCEPSITDPRFTAYFEPLPQGMVSGMADPLDDEPLTLPEDPNLPAILRHRKPRVPAKDRVAALYVRRGPEFMKRRAKALAAILRGKAKKKAGSK